MMNGGYRLFGAETSAYSTKLRAYLAYKGVEHAFVPRNEETEAEFASLSRMATLPFFVTPSGFAIHDTTELVDALEADRPEPAARPADPVVAFLAAVLEEYADVWLAKAVYHYRWTRKKDQRVAAQRAIEDYYTQNPPEDRKSAEDAAIVRMLGEMGKLQLEGELGDVVEKSFKRFIKLLDDHLRQHLFIFGGRPSIADFAIGGQLIQMLKDPTPAKIIEKDGEFVARWCGMLTDPKASGDFEPLEKLQDTLAPIFASELAAAFLPWAAENLESSLASKETFTVTLGKDEVTIAPLRSAARSFRELRRKFVAGQQIEALKAFTDQTEATVFLLRPQLPERPPREERVVEDEASAGEAAPGEEAAAAAEGEAPGEGEEGARRRKRRRRRRRGGRREEGAQTAGADAADSEGDADADGADDDQDDDEAVAAAAPAAGDADPAIDAGAEEPTEVASVSEEGDPDET